MVNRRNFLIAAAAAMAARTSSHAAERLPIRKALYASMLPRNMSWADRMKLARDVGFEEIELPTIMTEAEAEECRKASEAADLRIHSVMNSLHWKFPLSSADPAVVAESVKCLETSIRNAKLWKADTVLLVPAVVNPETGYKDAWVRSQREIRKILPLAADSKVIIGIENVGNKFLLSPLEMAQYVDEFKSPWVRAYFDVGNMIRTGYPQDWIRTLGKRIVKLHFKDPSLKELPPGAKRAPLLEGDIDWKAVYAALKEIGYRGTATLEIGGGDEAYLRDVSRRFDIILTGGTTA